MLAVALVLDGASRTDAARAPGMDRLTLRDWAHRPNAEGLAGLADRHDAFGPKRSLSPEQEAKVAGWCGAGRHQIGGRLRVPDNLTLPHLPPCKPEPSGQCLEAGSGLPARQQARQPRVRDLRSPR